MTIEKGQPWGEEVERPPELRVVGTDHELATALTDGTDTPTAVSGGDLHRTLGGGSIVGRDSLRALPLDLIGVTFDDAPARVAAAHVVARSPWWRGSWWRGPVLFVMNSEFLGDWDIAPRGHPNDGRVETQLADPGLRLRDRWSARHRLASGGHIPHPEITTRSVRSASWTFPYPLDVLVDGRFAGRSASVAVAVRPDAATIYS